MKQQKGDVEEDMEHDKEESSSNTDEEYQGDKNSSDESGAEENNVDWDKLVFLTYFIHV